MKTSVAPAVAGTTLPVPTSGSRTVWLPMPLRLPSIIGRNGATSARYDFICFAPEPPPVAPPVLQHGGVPAGFRKRVSLNSAEQGPDAGQPIGWPLNSAPMVPLPEASVTVCQYKNAARMSASAGNPVTPFGSAFMVIVFSAKPPDPVPLSETPAAKWPPVWK